MIFHCIQRNCLLVKLSERLIEYFPGVESFSNQPPFLDEFIFIDEDQHPIEFHLSVFPDIIFFYTSLGTFRLFFQNEQTICIQVPDRLSSGISFHLHSLKWSPVQSGGEIASYKKLRYVTNGKTQVNQLITNAEDSRLVLLLEKGENRSIILTFDTEKTISRNFSQPENSIASTHQTWQTWFDQIPAVDEIYQPTYAYAWWVLLNNMYSPKGNIRYPVISPSKKKYIGIWLWDNAFHALALRHLDPQLAQDQIRAFLQYQQPDGMLPDAIFDDGIVTEVDHPIFTRVTKPPILAWVALKIYEIKHDLQFLKEIYDPLVLWNNWWFHENDSDQDGYVEYNHPFSSGMDDNPTWNFGMPVESPDINTYLYIQMKSLATIAGELGKPSEVHSWSSRAETLMATMIKHAWDEKKGCFSAISNNKVISVLSPINLLPIWISSLPDTIKERLLSHLMNPNEFFGEWMLPTVARNDPAYIADKMWCGPVWVNINYFFIEALFLNGKDDLAKVLREKTLSMIMQQESIYEYYNSATGKPGTNAAAAFSWSAALFIDLAIQASMENQGSKFDKRIENAK